MRAAPRRDVPRARARAAAQSPTTLQLPNCSRYAASCAHRRLAVVSSRVRPIAVCRRSPCPRGTRVCVRVRCGASGVGRRQAARAAPSPRTLGKPYHHSRSDRRSTPASFSRLTCCTPPRDIGALLRVRRAVQGVRIATCLCVACFHHPHRAHCTVQCSVTRTPHHTTPLGTMDCESGTGTGTQRSHQCTAVAEV